MLRKQITTRVMGAENKPMGFEEGHCHAGEKTTVNVAALENEERRIY